jgi:hypothetical protein
MEEFMPTGLGPVKKTREQKKLDKKLIDRKTGKEIDMKKFSFKDRVKAYIRSTDSTRL